MGRFYGKVGYAETKETAPGVWEDTIVERCYYGDITRKSSRWSNSQGVNDDLTITQDISIVADPYAYENFSMIKYVEYMGAKWKVTSVTVERPRLILSTGGLYNG